MRNNHQSRNVILTGFMGSGKSTVGVLLAEILVKEFVDTDTMIEQIHGPIPEYPSVSPKQLNVRLV